MSLVVVHGDTSVELSALRLGEDRVGRYGTFDIKATGFQFLNGGDNLLRLLIAEHTVLTGMGVQTSHPDMWLLDTKLTTGIVYQFHTLDDTSLLHQVTSLPQRDMGRDMDDADVLVGKHHGIFLCIGEGGVDLRMSVIMMSCKIQRLFVQGCCHRTVYLIRHGEVYRFLDILEGGIATLWLYLTELKSGEVDTLQVIDINSAILKLGVLDTLYGIHL